MVDYEPFITDYRTKTLGDELVRTIKRNRRKTYKPRSPPRTLSDEGITMKAVGLGN